MRNAMDDVWQTTSPCLTEERYLLYERAAILEFDAGNTREVAEFGAIQQVLGGGAVHRGIRSFADYERLMLST